MSDRIVIAKVDADAHKELGSRFSVKGFPTLKWFPRGSKTPEDYSGGRDLKDFQEFINKKTSLNGKFVKPISFVKEVDTSTFDKTVKKPGVNALVEFYAPWCGHCKTLKPIYEQVAKNFATESKCAVVAVDATASPDLASKYDVTGYPTLKFFKADVTEPIPYEGGRTEQDLVNFLNEHCGTFRVVGGGLNEKVFFSQEKKILLKYFLNL